jgi:APA family basic amino acid/polyamine antiporter
MTSIGTLFAFVLVSIGTYVMRRIEPTIVRPFRVPALPLVSTLGALVCGSMIFGLGWPNWLRLFVWLAIGLAIYFGYGSRRSRVARLVDAGVAPE